MKIIYSLVILSFALFEANGFPYYPYYGPNVDSLSIGASDSARGGMALSRYYNPYYNNPQAAGVGGGMAAFMFKQPEETQPQQPQTGQYYLADRRRQTQPEFVPPQQNEIFYPQSPEKPIGTEATEIADPTERTEVLSTTLSTRTGVPELAEPEIEEVEEPVPKPRKKVSKKKQVRKPVDDEEDEDDYQPRLPTGAYFPMFFGWGSRAGGAPGGATAIANAYSTGRGGVASSHATAYGAPRPETKL